MDKIGFFRSQLFVTPAYPTASLTGQTAIITGSNVGLGKEAARHIARLGASKVILAVRNLTAGESARNDIISTTKCDSSVVEVWSLDLGNYASVQAFANRATRDLSRLDMLVENAGIATDKYKVFEGHESTITVNVISTFLLALLLLPKLRSTATSFGVHPRLTIVSSEVHAWTKFAERNSENGIFPALDGEASANMPERYLTSKLLEVLVIREIAPKMVGSGVVLNYLNPGLCHSELGRDAGWGLWLMKMVLARTTEVGSRTLVAAAAAGEESHGKYMNDGEVNEMALSPFVRSEEGAATAKKVWAELKAILEDVKTGVTQEF